MYPSLFQHQFDLSNHKKQSEQKVHNLACYYEDLFASDVPEETKGNNVGIRRQTSRWELFKQKSDNTEQVGVCVVNGKFREDSSCVAVQPIL